MSVKDGIKIAIERLAKQFLIGRDVTMDPGHIIIALAIFYLATVIEEKK